MTKLKLASLLTISFAGLALLLPSNSFAAQAQGGQIDTFNIQPTSAKPGDTLNITFRVTLFSTEIKNYCGWIAVNPADSLHWEVNESVTGAPDSGFASANVSLGNFTNAISKDLSFTQALSTKNGLSTRTFYSAIYCRNLLGVIGKKIAQSGSISIADTSVSGGGNPPPGGGTPGQGSTYMFNIPNPLAGGASDLTGLVQILASWLFKIAVPIGVAVIIWAGIQYLTSHGEPAQITKARKTLTYAVIGLAIIFIGSGFIALIKSILDLGGTNNSNGSQQQQPPINPFGGNNPPPGGQPPAGPFQGDGSLGSVCGGSADAPCDVPLLCRKTGIYSMCEFSGGNDVGDPCLGGTDCANGLSCDLSSSASQTINGRIVGTCYQP